MICHFDFGTKAKSGRNLVQKLQIREDIDKNRRKREIYGMSKSTKTCMQETEKSKPKDKEELTDCFRFQGLATRKAQRSEIVHLPNQASEQEAE